MQNSNFLNSIEKKIIHIEGNKEKASFSEFTDVEVLYPNIVEQLKNKYTKEEIKKSQEEIFSILDDLILSTKKVFIYFSKDKLTVDIPDDEIVSLFYKQLRQLENDEDYLDDMAQELKHYFSSYMLPHLKDINKETEEEKYEDKELELGRQLSTPYRQLFFYFKEVGGCFRDGYEILNIWLHYSHTDYGALPFFRRRLNKLLELKKMFISFFLMVSTNDEIINKSECLSFSKFFYTYEYKLCFDLLVHITSSVLPFLKRLGVQFNRVFPPFCIYYIGSVIFKSFNVESRLFNKYYDFFIYSLIPEYQKFLIDNENTRSYYSYTDLIKEKYIDVVFVSYNQQKNGYEVIFDDQIVTFEYLISVTKSLDLGVGMHENFINCLILKTNEQ